MLKQLLCIFFLFSFSSLVSAQTVYITKTGSKYHLGHCGSLSKSSIEIDLNDAVSKGYGPCARCRPPSTTSSKSERKVSTSKQSESSQCAATTKKGTRCKRKAAAGSSYCWQHN